MKMIKLNCPNCGGELNVNKDELFCKYCGAKLLLDDESQNINYTYRKVDDARIKEVERKEAVRLKELEIAANEKEREHKWKRIKSIGSVSLIVLFYVYVFFFMGNGSDDDIKGPEIERVKVTAASKDYKGENYLVIKKELENAGFINIDLMAEEDLVTGWITKDGSIERISINGDNDFDDYSYFPVDAKIVITYHTFKDKEDDDK